MHNLPDLEFKTDPLEQSPIVSNSFESLVECAGWLGLTENHIVTISAYLECAATAIMLAIYISIVEPWTHIFVENRPMRWKVQGGFMRVVEHLVLSLYDRAFTYELVGFDEINTDKLALVMSNHQGFIDYFTLMALAHKSGIDNSIFFFVWKHCVRFPNLGVLYNIWRRRSNWRVPNSMLNTVLSPVLESSWKQYGGKWIVIYPEVTPWTLTDQHDHRTRCEEVGCPKLENLLYPRFNAFVQTIQFLRDPMGDVYDLTISYIDTNGMLSTPTWWEVLFSRKSWKIRVELTRTAVASLPHKEKHLIRWLEKRWFEKDAFITKIKHQYAQASEIAHK